MDNQNNMNQSGQNPRGSVTGMKIVATIVIILFVFATAWYFIDKGSANGQISQNDQTQSQPIAEVPTPTLGTTDAAGSSVSTSKYKNGSYTAVGSYMTHVGPENITVTLTLQNDVVTNSTVTEGARDEDSVYYQNAFISGYKPYVIGKPIDQVNVGTVSGSSLTPIGFNKAVAAIKAQAAM